MVDQEHFWRLEHLSHRQLLDRLQSVLQTQRCALAELIAHLGEVEERRLHLAAAHGSMFSYCIQQLGMSEDEACRRIELARLARRFPLLFGEVASGGIGLSVALLLKPVLTPDNHAELLAAVRGASLRKARELLAARFLSPDVPSLIRKLPVRPFAHAIPAAVADVARPMTAVAGIANAVPAAAADIDNAIPAGVVDVAPAHRTVTTPGGTTVTTTAATLTSPQPSRSPEVEIRSVAGVGAGSLLQDPPTSTERSRAPVQTDLHRYSDSRQSAALRQRIEPLSAARYHVQFTADGSLKQKLELARDLLRHSHPSGDLAPIVSRALDLLLQELLQRRFGARSKDKPRHATETAPHAAAAVAGQPIAAPQSAALRPSTLAVAIAAPARVVAPGVRSPRATAPPVATPPATTPAAAPLPGARPSTAAPLATTPRGSGSGNPLAATSPAETPSATTPPATTPTPQIGRAARRAVLERDGLGCAWVEATGKRCGSTAWLELDHRHPSGKGGRSEQENLRLLCRAHNRFAAERAYGRDYIERAIQARQQSSRRRRQSERPPAPSPARV